MFFAGRSEKTPLCGIWFKRATLMGKARFSKSHSKTIFFPIVQFSRKKVEKCYITCVNSFLLSGRPPIFESLFSFCLLKPSSKFNAARIHCADCVWTFVRTRKQRKKPFFLCFALLDILPKFCCAAWFLFRHFSVGRWKVFFLVFIVVKAENFQLPAEGKLSGPTKLL